MAKRAVRHSGARRRRWRRTALALGLLIASAASVAWLLGARDGLGGTPRLVLDRTDVDLGDLAFEAPAGAVFTVRNVGDGVLKLAGAPSVSVVRGC